MPVILVAQIITAVVALYAMFWALYVVVLPLLGGLRPGRHRGGSPTNRNRAPSVAVIVPSHQMEAVIGRCVKSLRSMHYPADRLQVFVVADHCSDNTAAEAQAAGATSLVRNDGPPGKTYTIAWTLEQLRQQSIQPDLYVVTDATAHVDPGFLAGLAQRWQQGEDIVVAHSLVDMANQQWFAQCMGLTLVHRNMQNLARERLALSALIEGRGMAYSSEYIGRHGWSLALPTSNDPSAHPTEDWRHGVRVVEHGHRVAFAADAHVFTPLRESLSAATQQGMRWERGRMANAATHGLHVLAEAVRQRSARMLFAALDAIQLPVAVLGAVCVLAAVLALLVPGPGWLRALGVTPLVLVGIYGCFVIIQGHREGIRASTIAWAPIYVLWRCTSFVLGLVAPNRK